VKGKMSIQGQEKEIQKTLDNKAFSGGAGLGISLGALALKKDYMTNVTIFDTNSQELRTYRLDVTNEETISAGRQVYDCLKVELKSIDGSGGNMEFWYEKGTNLLVKSVKILKEMNGAKISSEILSY